MTLCRLSADYVRTAATSFANLPIPSVRPPLQSVPIAYPPAASQHQRACGNHPLPPDFIRPSLPAQHPPPTPPSGTVPHRLGLWVGSNPAAPMQCSGDGIGTAAVTVAMLDRATELVAWLPSACQFGGTQTQGDVCRVLYGTGYQRSVTRALLRGHGVGLLAPSHRGGYFGRTGEEQVKIDLVRVVTTSIRACEEACFSVEARFGHSRSEPHSQAPKRQSHHRSFFTSVLPRSLQKEIVFGQGERRRRRACTYIFKCRFQPWQHVPRPAYIPCTLHLVVGLYGMIDCLFKPVLRGVPLAT
jgi:hypothetical protein